MKNTRKIQVSMFIVVFICATTFAQVTSDYDKTVDFSKYNTYSFAGWHKGSDTAVNSLDLDRLQSAFKDEFSKRGMTLVTENADAILTLYIVIQNKTSTTAYTDYTGGVGVGVAGWGWGMGPGMGMGTATTNYSEDDYQVGTLVADIYDASTKKLAWQGVSQSTVQVKASKRDKTIPKKVGKLMAKYPIEPTK